MKIFTTLNPDYIYNIYLVTDNEQKYGVIIDPGSFYINVYRLIQSTGVEIKKIIVTQNSKDQTEGIPLLKKIYDAEIFAFNKKISNFEATKVKDDYIIREGELEFKVIETPVHSYDAISILSTNVLFIGNIFQAGTLNAFEEKENPTEYEFQIIKNKILTLPDSTIIYPGKGPASTIEIEINFNPYFKKILESDKVKT